MPLSWNEIKDRALKFSREWADEASEDAEAKSFWDGFFNVYGVSRRRVGTFEQRVKKLDGRDGFIDLLWKGVLLVEHKSRGKDLDRAHKQARDYFHGLTDAELPKYLLVSDFARFRLYDLDGDEAPVEFDLKDLHKHVRRFGFIAGYQPRAFKEEDPVNVLAAERMGKLHDALKAAGYDGHALEVLLVRLLFCLFADDTGIFARNAFHELVAQRTSPDGADLGQWLAQLFQTLNTDTDKRQKTLDAQLAEFPYVNGKLFAEPLPLAAFDAKMRSLLLDASTLDWSRISPAIFGSMFQSVMDAKARRNLGAHYTSEKNILKLIGPLFLDDLKAELERIGTHEAKLKAFHTKLARLKFLDPACGCGNFLVIAYRELRQVELEVLARLYSRQGSVLTKVADHVAVDVDQFYGIEIEEFPAQIAQVALWLMDHQMNLRVAEQFGEYFARLPLKKSPTIVHGNALRTDWNDVVPANQLSYILGNPPFIGHHLQTAEQKTDMLAAIGDAKAAGVLDFVTAWYAKAVDMIAGTGIQVAYVSTNSITQGEQVGILWRALSKRRQTTINFAHRTFRWTNEARGKAAVYCVIIGFAEHDNPTKTIFEYESVGGDPHPVPAKSINAYLVDAPWVLLENRSKNPFGKPEMMYGSKPTDDGNFLFTDSEKGAFLAAEPRAAKYIKPFLGAHEYLHNEKRWVLWLVGVSPAEILALPMVQSRVKAVAAFRRASKAASTRDYSHPTLFRQVTQPTADYVLIPGHTSESRAFIPFGFFGKDTILGNSCFSLPGATLYHFGVIQSTMHMAWVRYTCGRLKSDFRYSKDVVYNNFPWPDSPTEAQRSAIEKAAQAVLDARLAHPESTLADLYDPTAMPPDLVKAHQSLDRALDASYGKKAFKSDADRVAFLFERYQAMTSLLPSPVAKKAARRRKESA
ncbi:class I SAM-dependent DNA methyltransferase [Xanthomonas campestris]|uniref:class I SAM-dependent DNA methyltransferase n=1 Tax=Xanthomonas campestris TaxID=339 RepID=UPI0023672BE0|nr:DNA methyltransferase [Xanthomonas campestris]WDJ04738.1 class I SAM-dependent DNA methyltransferase [Xanthomonas campestris pv. incanae]